MKVTLCLIGIAMCTAFNLVLPSSASFLRIFNQKQRGDAHSGVTKLHPNINWLAVPIIRTVLQTAGDSELYLKKLPKRFLPTVEITDAILNLREGYNSIERIISLIRAQLELHNSKEPIFRRVVLLIGREGRVDENIKGYGEKFQTKFKLPQVLSDEDVKMLLGDDASANPVGDYNDKLTTVSKNIKEMDIPSKTPQAEEWMETKNLSVRKLVDKLHDVVKEIRRDNVKSAQAKAEFEKSLDLLKELMFDLTKSKESVVEIREANDANAFETLKNKINPKKSISFEGAMGTAGQGGFTIQDKAMLNFKVNYYLHEQSVISLAGDVSCGAGAEDVPENQKHLIVTEEEAIAIGGLHVAEPQRRNVVVCEVVKESIEKIQEKNPDFGSDPEEGTYNVAIPRTDKDPEFFVDALDTLLKLKAAFAAVSVPVDTVVIQKN